MLHSNKGFTLIELMIAVSLFTVVMVVSTTMFLRSIDTQARSVKAKSLQEGMNYALSIMANEATNAIQDPTSCDPGFSQCIVGTDFFCAISSNTKLRFRNSNSDCVLYELENDSNGVSRLKITRKDKTGYLTPEDISISSLKFYAANDNDTTYPIGKVTIELYGQAVNREKNPDTLRLQTTVATWPTQ